MIRKEFRNGWIIFTQNDHARLAAEIMKYWGNTVFQKYTPWEDLLFAIKEHDSGWFEWDSSPRVNPENNYPMNFMEMSTQDQHEIWSKCYRKHSTDHKYASALIAMHFQKFNCKSISKNPCDGESIKLKREIENFISEMLELHSSDYGTGPFNKIKENLKFLQIGDIISLTLCHSWRSVHIEEVPVNYNGDKTDLTISSYDGINYSIKPYPFSHDYIEFKIRGKRLNRKNFNSDEELRHSIDQAEFKTFEYVISRS